MQENAQALRRLQGDSLRMLMLACAFFIFFAASKHLPAWSKINPFADDPADAVASIAIQAAIFLATLSCIRAFRERSAGIAVDALA